MKNPLPTMSGYYFDGWNLIEYCVVQVELRSRKEKNNEMESKTEKTEKATEKEKLD